MKFCFITLLQYLLQTNHCIKTDKFIKYTHYIVNNFNKTGTLNIQTVYMFDIALQNESHSFFYYSFQIEMSAAYFINKISV